MLKKDIKAVFQAIRSGSLDRVASLVAANPAVVHVCNFAPPKKDDGQSTLQVAFKTGGFNIARFLIEQGANINFIEQSEINEWKAPVLHDCIRAVIFSSYTLNKNQAVFEEGFNLLQLLLDSGADPNAVDSYGNTCLHRALLDANQMINHPDANVRILAAQLKRVFNALLAAGADPEVTTDNRPSAASFARNFGLDKYQLFKRD